MIDKTALITRAIAWEKAHTPNTGYTELVFRKVCSANLVNGENLLTQVAAQFTGTEELADAVHWDSQEQRIGYSNTYRYSLDKSADCSSFWFIMFKIFFSINIGTWTEEMYTMWKSKSVPWAQRRVGDLVLYNFKKSQGRNASHVACIMRAPDSKGIGGLIGHTTSPSNPFRFEADSYSAASRIGVYRVLTNEQYQKLIVTDHKSEAPVPSDLRMDLPKFPTLRQGITSVLVSEQVGITQAVRQFKLAMNQLYGLNLNLSNTNFLDECVKATLRFQKDLTHRDQEGKVLIPDGEVGAKTWYAIAVALSKK